jgi:hypothetical protein
MPSVPMLSVYGVGTVPCRPDDLGICMELSLLAVTQYSNFSFNSMCKFGDEYVGCNDFGVFTLDGDTDNGVDIYALFELMSTDFGVANQKRIRKLYLGYETSGDLVVFVKDDDNNVRRYTVDAALADQRQHSVKVPVGRDGKGRYWSFGVENVRGCDFSIDSIDALVAVLPTKSGKVSDNTASLVIPIMTVCGVGD